MPTALVTLEARELATKSVLVYQDRAEVKRAICVQIPREMRNEQGGRVLIRVNNVSPMIARDSIRVEGQRAGALILEVEYVEMPQFAMASGDTDEDDGVGSGVPLDAVGGVDDTTTDGGGGMQLSQLERHAADLESECAALNDQMEVLQRRLEVLDGVAKQIGKNALVSTDSSDQLRRCLLPPMGAEAPAMLPPCNNNPSYGCHLSGGIGQQGTNFSSATAPAQFAPTSLFLLSEDSMKNLSSFLDYYAKSASETRKEMRDKSKQLTALKEKLAKAEWELNKQRGKMEYDKHKRAINVLLEVQPTQQPQQQQQPTDTVPTTAMFLAAEDEEPPMLLELHLIYQVFGCTWRPAYSLRASSSGVLINNAVGTTLEQVPPAHNTSDGEDQQAKEKTKNVATGKIGEDCPEAVLLSYHGLVEQNTDEDWRDAELILSTAQPCSAGAIPCLPTINAMLQRTMLSGFRQRNLSTVTARHHRQRMLLLQSHVGASQEDLDAGIGGSFDYNELVDAQHLQQQMRAAVALGASQLGGSGSDNCSIQSVDHLPSVYFPIDHPCTIPSDGHGHKVDIAHIELTPTFWHECVPSRLASAFVNAKLVNSSQLPLLPGPLSVFFNNSFVSTCQLKLVLPGDEFRCFLGVDPAVKVEYKRANLSNEQYGFMTKKSLSTHEQTISLRNAKANRNVQLTVREPVPKSMDENVKIVLIAPDAKAQRAECRLNKEHNLEWTVTLAPGEQRELVVKWTAEYPAQECVLFSSGNTNTTCPSIHHHAASSAGAAAPTYGRTP